jgi:O-acetyl-ADP-ribose deacetylase (regulator of RNase III)
MTSERIYLVGSSSLTLRFGNLLTSPAEVLVSSDDYLLTMGGGVSAGIRTAAGSGLLVDVQKSIPRRLGDVVVTSAGLLSARYVFHVVTIGPADGGPAGPEQSIERAVNRCFDLMEPLGVHSIAFPALGTGVARYSVQRTAVLMATVIADRLQKSAYDFDVSLYLYARPGVSEREFIAFYEEFARLQPRVTPAVAPPSQPASGEPRAESELIALERERQRLEQQIVEVRRQQGSTASESQLSEELSRNQERRLEAASEAPAEPAKSAKIFISYAHEDRPYLDMLTKQLSDLKRRGIVRDWHDRMIKPGLRWQDEIDQALEEARIVVFLISPDFIASEYINSVEVKRAMERHTQGVARIIPVIVKDVFWAQNSLSMFQALPADGHSIAGSANKDKAFVEVVEGIYEVIQGLPAEPAS